MTEVVIAGGGFAGLAAALLLADAATSSPSSSEMVHRSMVMPKPTSANGADREYRRLASRTRSLVALVVSFWTKRRT